MSKDAIFLLANSLIYIVTAKWNFKKIWILLWSESADPESTKVWIYKDLNLLKSESTKIWILLRSESTKIWILLRSESY